MVQISGLFAPAAGAATPEEALKKIGVSFEAHEHAPGQKNVIARVKGDGGARPLLVVAGPAAEKLGLELVSLVVERKPRLVRDVIVAFTSGGEASSGMAYALKEHRAAVDAEYALVLAAGAPGLTVVDKTYQDYLVRATGPAAETFAPTDDSAITRLARGLLRIAGHRFPPRKGTQLRTTCVATQVHGGTREDVFPVEAYANLSCRVLPEESPAEISRRIAEVLGDPKLEVRAVPPLAGPSVSSPVQGPVVDAVRKALGVPITPGVSAAATDARLLRAAGVAAYGVSLGDAPETLYRITVDIAEKP